MVRLNSVKLQNVQTEIFAMQLLCSQSAILHILTLNNHKIRLHLYKLRIRYILNKRECRPRKTTTVYISSADTGGPVSLKRVDAGLMSVYLQKNLQANAIFGAYGPAHDPTDFAFINHQLTRCNGRVKYPDSILQVIASTGTSSNFTDYLYIQYLTKIHYIFFFHFW